MSKVISAGKAVMIGSFVSKGISVISTIILARILMPEDYGALVLSMVITGLITQIGSLGYELYFLQYKGSEEERMKVLEQVFNLRLLTNLILGGIQIILGLVVIFLFNEVVSGGIILLLSFSLLIEGFNAPQETLLKDTFDFKKITIGNIIKELFSTAGKVFGALLGLGGFVFGIGPIIGSLIRLFYYRKAVAYSATYFNWDRDFYIKPLKFGVQNLLGGVGMYMIQQADKIFLTTYFNKVSVGFYSFAWSNASVINNYLINPQGQVILSYITKFKPGDKELFFKLRILQRLFVIVALPLLTILNGFIEPIVLFLFTEKWFFAVPLVKILLVYFSINLIISPFMSVLTGLGYPQINTKLVYSRAIILIPSLFFVAFLAMDISIYLIVFVTINVMFEFIKVGVATRKMGMHFFDFIWKSKADFIMVLIAAFSAFYIEGFLVFISLGIILVTAFLDLKKTKEAILFAKNAIYK